MSIYILAQLPKANGASYHRPIGALNGMLPSTGNKKTIVVDRCSVQLKSFHASYPEAGFVPCSFRALMNMRRRCVCLPVIVEKDGECIHQWICNLEFASTREDFHDLKAVIGSGCLTALTPSTCIAVLKGQAGILHWKMVSIFSIFTTSGVEVENSHLKHDPFVRSSLVDVYSRTL